MIYSKEFSVNLIIILFFTIIYVFNKYHIINNLIICEYIVTIIMIIVFKITRMIQLENYLVIFILVVTISESVVGLCLIVNLIRTHRNDFIKTITLIKF